MSAEQAALLPGNPPPPLGERDITPLTVLHTARRDWQARRKAWLDAGLDDGDGRTHISVWPTITPEEGIRWQRRVSIFDPVLAEIFILWHTRPGDTVLDPFAGGPVRGLVAAHLGRHYIGIDISPSQVAANQARRDAWAARGLLAGSVTWHVGAAQRLLPEFDPETVDYVLTCPPYHDLERYTDDPADLSVMAWEEYVQAVHAITAETARILRPDRWATWVTGDLRDKRGHLRRLPAMVDAAHEQAGMPLVNDQIVVTPLGGKFGVLWRSWGGRSATRVHQHAHTYIRGDRRRAAARLRAPGGGG